MPDCHKAYAEEEAEDGLPSSYEQYEVQYKQYEQYKVLPEDAAKVSHH